RIANSIELGIILKNKELSRKKRSKVQRETRIAKRTYYYEFYLFENDYDYKKIEKESVGYKISLGKNDFYIDINNSGVFKGSEIDLIEFLDSLYIEQL